VTGSYASQDLSTLEIIAPVHELVLAGGTPTLLRCINQWIQNRCIRSRSPGYAP
jgi:hypothetical protein